MRRTPVPAVLVALVLTAAACGGDDASTDATDVSLVPASPPSSIPSPSVVLPDPLPTELVCTDRSESLTEDPADTATTAATSAGGFRSPGTSTPDSTTPDSTTPESTTPDSTTPESTTPDAGTAETTVPDSAAPSSIPATTTTVPPPPPVCTDLQGGTGPESGAGDVVLVHYVGVRSEDGTEFDSSYGRGQPYPVQVGNGDVIAGWDQGLLGVEAGQRLQLDIPSALAYGDADYGEIIKAGDALSFVIDVLAVIPPNDPADEPTQDEIPLSETAFPELSTTDPVPGDGVTADVGMTVYVNYVLARADNGAILDDTWTIDEANPTAPIYPKQLILVEGQEIPGLINGIVGMKVGGRRVINVPFADAYGAEGRPPMGLPAETDVVIVADLVGAY